MASAEQLKARPDSPRGIRELFDSVRGILVEGQGGQGRRYSCRPQRGSGAGEQSYRLKLDRQAPNNCS
eukprot:s932_g11.t1